MSGLRTILTSTAMVAVLGLGFGLWQVLGTEDRWRNLSKNLPKSNLVRKEETRERNALMMKALKDAAETNNNIVRGTAK
ncbi:hypothetical protein PAMA_018836 [Pampus argenteus]